MKAERLRLIIGTRLRRIPGNGEWNDMTETTEFKGASGKTYVLRYATSEEYDDIQKQATIRSARLIDDLLEETAQRFPNGQKKPRKREEGLSIGEQIAAQALAVMEVQKLLLRRTLVSIDGRALEVDADFHELVPGKDRPGLEKFAFKMNQLDEEEAKKSEEPSSSEKTIGSEKKE